MGSLLSTAADQDLKFKLRIELDGKTPKDVIDQLNRLLNEVNGDLKF